MRVLVTGATGFVGPHVLRFLEKASPGAEVFALLRPQGAARPVVGGARVLEADLEDSGAIRAAVAEARPDRVIHLAGQSSVHQSWFDPGTTLRHNVLGAVHLFEAFAAAGIAPRVLVVGSADTYGMAAASGGPIREAAPLRPHSPYAVSKAAQELLALQYASPGGPVVIATRTFPHTGPGRGEMFAESGFARQVAEIEAGLRAPVVMVGNLDAVRDFTDVRDVVRAYWSLLEHAETGVYNVCCGRGVRIGDVLDELVRAAGLRIEVRQDPQKLRPADIPVLVGDPGKLQRATGWAPAIPLSRTLGDLLADWRARTAAAAQ